MDMMPEIPQNLQDEVERQLEQGERIVWMEQPIPRFFTPQSTPQFVAAIPVMAFAVLWIGSALGWKPLDFHKGGSDIFPLFGLIPLVFGLGLLFAPLWARRKAFKTVYVITDRRAMTFDGGWTTTIRSYAPDQLKNMYRKERKDGTGDVVLDRVFSNVRVGGQPQMTDVGFLRVRDVRKTEQMLRDLIGQFGPSPQ